MLRPILARCLNWRFPVGTGTRSVNGLRHIARALLCALRAPHLCELCVRYLGLFRVLQHKPRRLCQLRVLHRERHFRQPHRRPLRCPIENAIRHALCAQRFVALLAQYPRNRIHHVRLPAPIWPHDASSPGSAERHDRTLAERLKPCDFHFPQLKQGLPFCPSSHAQSQIGTPSQPAQPPIPVGAQPACGRQAPLRNKHHGPLVQRETKLYLQGRSYRRRQPDRDAVARQNVWQVLDQSPAAWRVNGGTGKNTNTNLCRCKAFRNALWPTCPKPQGSELASSCLASSSAALPSSSTCHTTPKSDSTGPPNASPHETHAALADKPQTPPPLHIASNRDTVPGSAPADQPYPHRPAAPALASSHSSNARTASYSEIPLAAPTERRKTIRPPRDDPLCQIPKSGSPSPRQKPPP